MKTKIFLIIASLMISSVAFAAEFRCTRASTPEGLLTYRLTPESAKLVSSRRCVRAGTKLTVVGRITGRTASYGSLDVSVSPVNFRSGIYYYSEPTINSDGTFRYDFITPKHTGPTGRPLQSIGFSVTDHSLAIDIPGSDQFGICEMRKRPSRNVSFRACIQR
jgi:hypothetical protein